MVIIILIIIQIGIITALFILDDKDLFKTKADIGRWYLYALVPLLPVIVLLIRKVRSM